MNDLMTLRLLCERMVDLQNQKDALDEQSKMVGEELDKLRLIQIPETMAAQGIKNATFDGLGRVQLANDIYASTRAGKKEEVIQWLRDCGYEGMVTETVNASTLKALLRRLLIDGTPYPDDLLNVTPFTRASIVKN